MKSALKKALKLLTNNQDPVSFTKKTKKRPFKELTERELIQLESQIGAELFGPVKPGARREFFNEKADSWIWHEEWLDEKKKRQTMTTRYEIRDDGIAKVCLGQPFIFITGEELNNFAMAVQLYYERVMREVYKRDHKTGKPLN